MTGNIQEEPTTEPEPYEKCYESDGEMLVRISKKFAVIIAVFLLFDTLIDILSAIVDFSTEILHICIEIIEYSLEMLIQYILQANHHQSETILANVTLLCSPYLLYKFSFVVHKAIIKQTHHYQTAWMHRKCRETATWKALTLIRKIKIMITYLVGITLILFLVTL